MGCQAMSDEVLAVGIAWKILGLIGGTGLAIIGFFTKRVIADVDKLKAGNSDCKLDLANFKTEVANNYAKDASVQASLARIHDRMEMAFTEIRTDIKKILMEVKK